MKTVSAIIPCYNQGHFLSEAIESALAQTYPLAEIIVVDDGSTDNTPEVAARYGRHIHYIRKCNEGVSIARNIAIENSRGELIALLDADDRWLPQKLEQQISYFNSDPAVALCFSSFRYFGSDLATSMECLLPDNQTLDVHDILFRTVAMQVPTAIFRRDVLGEVGYFDTSYKYCEDWDMWLRIAQRHKVMTCGQILAEYRINEGSLSSTANAQQVYLGRMKLANEYKNMHSKCEHCQLAAKKMKRDAHAGYFAGLRTQAESALSKQKYMRALILNIMAIAYFPSALGRLLGSRQHRL